MVKMAHCLSLSWVPINSINKMNSVMYKNSNYAYENSSNSKGRYKSSLLD